MWCGQKTENDSGGSNKKVKSLVDRFIFQSQVIAIQNGNKSNVAYVSHVMGFIVGLGFGARWNSEWKKSFAYTMILLGVYIMFFLYVKEQIGL